MSNLAWWTVYLFDSCCLFEPYVPEARLVFLFIIFDSPVHVSGHYTLHLYIILDKYLRSFIM